MNVCQGYPQRTLRYIDVVCMARSASQPVRPLRNLPRSHCTIEQKVVEAPFRERLERSFFFLSKVDLSLREQNVITSHRCPG